MFRNRKLFVFSFVFAGLNGTGITVGYVSGQGIHDTPSISLRGEWLAEAGFPIGTDVTVKIANDCIVLVRDSDEVTGLRNELRQTKQLVKEMKAGVLNALGDKT